MARIIKPTFSGKITLNKMDRYIDFHRRLIIKFPPIWYFLPEQIEQLKNILLKFGVTNITGGLGSGFEYKLYQYKGIDIFPIP